MGLKLTKHWHFFYHPRMNALGVSFLASIVFETCFKNLKSNIFTQNISCSNAVVFSVDDSVSHLMLSDNYRTLNAFLRWRVRDVTDSS